MKKDLNWLKEEVDEVIEFRKQLNPSSDWGMGANTVLKYIKEDFKDLINQLDDPEVLSQEWIEGNSVYASSDGVTEEYVHVDDLQNLLVPKQEKVKVPRFVAEEIEKAKNNDDGLWDIAAECQFSRDENSLVNWIFDYDMSVRTMYERQDLVSRAWLDGFTVEEEQKYRVLDGNTTLLGRINGLMLTTVEILEYYPEYAPTFVFTEQEIKDYDKRFWPFAVKVEELEQ